MIATMPHLHRNESSRLTLNITAVCIAALCATAEILTPGSVTRAESRNAGSCTAAEYRQFDFWVGDWEVYEVGGSTPVAHVLVDRILDGCVLREQYEDSTGAKGQSFTIYDASRQVWHQTWVTDRGRLLVLEGKLEGADMVLRGAEQTREARTLIRGVWKPMNNEVRETAATSTDQGQTWKPWFDLLFRPAKH